MSEVIKIGRMAPGYSPDQSAQLFATKKVKALEDLRANAIPAWYMWICRKFPIMMKAVRVNIQYKSFNKEIVTIYFFGKRMEEITFIYF